ncbi:hypothetical protein KUA00_03925 [Proteus mirabilis]|uniref:hypothetical protein n=1 Tax=Proteus mirabilis TaxID=584 RepID=UPI00202575F5|nr:hypothetical protein [Proteus mirabilis]MCL8608936.1 hypothetical protein [Proteus mirabilis]MCT0124161.1 hypothetical protein [Proteus mirabilis]MDF7338108.1 hypothetical protein [Proteus mirabilis]
MFSDFWSWILSVAISTGLVGVIGYFLRDTLSVFFAKSVEHKFDRKLENFKAESRNNEKELEQIRTFLVSAYRERDSMIQTKKLEAAEILLRARHELSQLSILVEYMKILNTERILDNKGDPKITEFINLLIKPFDLDEKIKQLGCFDKTYPRLYLTDKSLKLYDAYEGIILNAAIMMKLFSLNLSNRSDFIKESQLSEKIIELVPPSKDGFKQFGEAYSYHWATHFYNEILRSLRHEISGADDLNRDAESAERLGINSRRAQMSIFASLEQVGLPDTLIKPDEKAMQSAVVAEKTLE